ELSASSNVPRICFGGVIFLSTLTLAHARNRQAERLPYNSLTKSAGNIILRALHAWVGENFRGRTELDQSAEVKEAGVLGNASSLVHVVRHSHDGVLGSQFLNQLLNFCGRNRIERRTGFVH